jgi:hypothetical protein
LVVSIRSQRGIRGDDPKPTVRRPRLIDLSHDIEEPLVHRRVPWCERGKSRVAPGTAHERLGLVLASHISIDRVLIQRVRRLHDDRRHGISKSRIADQANDQVVFRSRARRLRPARDPLYDKARYI